jgi:hypothetical protein
VTAPISFLGGKALEKLALAYQEAIQRRRKVMSAQRLLQPKVQAIQREFAEANVAVTEAKDALLAEARGEAPPEDLPPLVDVPLQAFLANREREER